MAVDRVSARSPLPGAPEPPTAEPAGGAFAAVLRPVDGSAVAPGNAGSAVAPGNAGSAVAPGNVGSAVAPGNAGSAVAPGNIGGAVALAGTGGAAPAAPLTGMAWIEAGVAEALARDAQDREARRHGRAMLQALGAVQHAILGGDGGQARSALVALAHTAQDAHEADDPVLKLILREIGVRAAVELARSDIEPAGAHIAAGRSEIDRDVSTG